MPRRRSDVLRRSRVRELACAVAMNAALSRKAVAEPDARNAYERALIEVQAGKLGDARKSFEEAYRLSPHYIVLYNLGRVSFDLGDLEVARDYFERYLEQGGSRIAPDDRERVETLIARTRVAPAPARSGSPDSPPAPAPSPPTPPSPVTGSSPGPRAPAPLPAAGDPLARCAAERADWSRRLVRERRTTLAITLGATGTVMSAVGTVILVWNDARHDEYETERRALGSPPAESIQSQDELDRALAYDRAHERNQAKLDSVKDFDVVGWSVASVGAALLTTGVIVYLTRPTDPKVAVGLGHVEVGLRF
jgi:tetratricopeptide (TPR) repeat protein